MLLPEQVAARERFLSGPRELFKRSLSICPPLAEMQRYPVNKEQFNSLRSNGWLVAVDNSDGVKLWWTRQCRPESLIKGYLHACLLRQGGEASSLYNNNDTVGLIDAIQLAGWNISELRLCDDDGKLLLTS